MIFVGVSHTEVYVSARYVIEQAINSSENFKPEYPENDDKQREIAAGFKALSEAGFDCCAGCVDGMLIWTHQPDAEHAEDLGVGPTKSYCARKGKFGLNLQAVCDHQYRFLDLSILYGRSSSDIVAFEASSIRQELEKPGFLADRLCLFGDNAYANRRNTMATPFPNNGTYTKERVERGTF